MSWFKHTFQQQPWRTQRQALALLTLSFFVAIIIGGLYLAQAATLSTTGRQLEDLIAVRTQLEQRNEQLRGEIASLRSVPRLEQRAREMGFVQASARDIEYLLVPGYDPRRGQQPVELALPPTPIPVYDETFIGWVQQQWDAFTSQLERGEP